jgi:hypothetical protein
VSGCHQAELSRSAANAARYALRTPRRPGSKPEDFFNPYCRHPRRPPSLSLTADHDIELTCGQSSLSMHKNGRITLRGTLMATAAEKENKIKGTSVLLN